MNKTKTKKSVKPKKASTTTQSAVSAKKTATKKAAEKVAPEATSYKLDMIPLSRIKTHEDINNRKVSRSGIDELAADLELNGLLQPIICWQGQDESEIEGKAVYLLAGQRRLKAIRKLKQNNSARFDELFGNGVPVHTIEGDRKKAIAAQLRENVQREEMDLKSILPFIEELKEEGMKNKDIAVAIAKSDAFVSQVLSIRKALGEEGVEALDKEEVGGREALEASKKVKKGKSKKEALEEAKTKTKSKKDKGRKRSEKRYSAKAVYKAWKAIPVRKLTTSVKLGVLDEALKYLAGETDSLPDELEVE